LAGAPGGGVGEDDQCHLISTQAGLISATIVGVARDARDRSARDSVEPAIFIDNPEAVLAASPITASAVAMPSAEQLVGAAQFEGATGSSTIKL
jgi:hypothetical protein